jgi:hypothetical protein
MVMSASSAAFFLLREFRRYRIGIRRRARNGQGAVDEGRVRLRLGPRLLLCRGKANAAGKCQRKRADPQEIPSHDCLLPPSPCMPRVSLIG